MEAVLQKKLTYNVYITRSSSVTHSCQNFNFLLHPSYKLDRQVPFDIFPMRCNITQFIYFWKTALHVLGGISTHHREHTQMYLQYPVLVKPLLLPAAIVEELEPV